MLLFKTYKLKIVKNRNTVKIKKTKTGIFYIWHQNIISGLFFVYSKKISGHCIASPSNDGKIAGYICKKLGLTVLYGSSYKNPISLVKQCLNVLQTKKQLFLVGDGSRGPAFKLQKGVLSLSKKTTLPLFHILCHNSSAYTIKKSWDQCKIPLPFSTITIEIQQTEN